MITPFALLSCAAALLIAPAGPAGRVADPALRTRNGTKTPRDGPARVDHARCASDITLFAACFRTGLPVTAAAAAVAAAQRDDRPGERNPWRTVAALTALGAEPEQAWGEMRALPGGDALANLVTMSNASGSAIVEGCERIAAQLREDAADDATAKAERAGVLIAIPLTACFLPAFFVLGLAPVVVSLGSTLLN